MQMDLLPDREQDARAALADAGRLLDMLDDWAAAGWIRPLDAEFARFLHEQTYRSQAAPAALLLAAALTSHQNTHGHVCLDLRACLQSPERVLSLPPEQSREVPSVQPAHLLEQLDIHDWLAQIQHPLLVSDGPGTTPLVLRHIRESAGDAPVLLYLRRFWQYEKTLENSILGCLDSPIDVESTPLRDILDTLFNARESSQKNPLLRHDWQKIACAIALRSRFAVITGGPGTGKTTTVVRLLSALLSLYGQQLRIRLAAPTGKAAARLGASIRQQRKNLPEAALIPSTVSTVHRLLGPLPHSRFFRHHATHPLPVDVVVIDEASMVDVELMSQLLEALPEHARLILLGDKDQLASVEAGAVLGTLCQRAGQAHYTALTAEWLNEATGERLPEEMLDVDGRALDQAIAMLRYSYRFGDVPGIGKLAEAVNNAAPATHFKELFSTHQELERLSVNHIGDSAFNRLISDNQHGYGYYLQKAALIPHEHAGNQVWDDWANGILEAHANFQLLAPTRKGEFGIEALNLHIRNTLRQQGLITDNAESYSESDSRWYAGRPVIVTRNDYNLKLMNGDIGIALPCAGRLRVAFPNNEHPGGIRWVLPARLQNVETVFAMTVHKSQGSEFVHTALVLPPRDNPVLTRELIYTAVTRARHRFTLIESHPEVLQKAVQTRVFRASGIFAT